MPASGTHTWCRWTRPLGARLWGALYGDFLGPPIGPGVNLDLEKWGAHGKCRMGRVSRASPPSVPVRGFEAVNVSRPVEEGRDRVTPSTG